MEVIPQQTIGKQIGNRVEMLFTQSQKKLIVPFFNEYIFTVHTTIVDVVIGVVE